MSFACVRKGFVVIMYVALVFKGKPSNTKALQSGEMTVECTIKCLQGRAVIKTHGLHIYLYATFSIKYPVTKIIVLRGPMEGILAAAPQKL